MSAWQPMWSRMLDASPIADAIALDLDYRNDRYRALDSGILVEKPWADIVNSYSAPAGRTYFDSSGVLQTAAANSPIRAYDPTTGEFLGNQIWGGYNNRFLWTESLSNAAWSKAGVTVAPPTLGFWPLTEDVSAGAEHYLQQAVTHDATTPCTFSFRALPGTAGGARTSRLRCYNASSPSNTFGVDFNPATGGYSTFSTGTGVVVSATCHVLLDGSTKVTVTGYTTTAGASVFARCHLVSGGSTVYPGDGISGVRLTTPKFSQTANEVPYSKNDGSILPIAAESQIIDGSVFSEIWNPAGGTLFIECSGAINAVALKAAGIEVIVDSASNKKYAVAYTSDPSATSLLIGANLNGFIRRIVYFRKELPASLITRLIA